MGRVLTTILPVYWAYAFAAAAFSGADMALGGQSAVTPSLSGAGLTVSMQLLLALGNGLAAVLFLWMFVTALFDKYAIPGDTDDVSSMAFGGAVVMAVAALAASRIIHMSQTDIVTAGSLAALLASYLAVHVERRTWRAQARPHETTEKGDGRAAARLMALGAAHSSVLSNLSVLPPRAPYPVPANDRGRS